MFGLLIIALFVLVVLIFADEYIKTYRPTVRHERARRDAMLMVCALRMRDEIAKEDAYMQYAQGGMTWEEYIEYTRDV